MKNEIAKKILKMEKDKLMSKPESDRDWELITALDIAIKALEDVKGLRLLVDWAVESDFGYDNIPEEYEKYKEEISDMRYTEGLIYIAKKEAENEVK